MLIFILGAYATHDGSLRVAAPTATITFHKRLSERLLAAFMGLFLALSAIAVYWLGVSDAIQHHQFAADEAVCALLIGAAIVGPFVGMFLYWSGPCDLSLDLEQRTYRFVCGWPQCPCVLEGPWEDMAGVYVSRINRQTSYHIKIAWRREKRACPELGCFSSEDDANTLADEISALLDIPRVKPPLSGRTSINPALSKLRKKPPLPPVRPFHPNLFSHEAAEPKANTKQSSV